MSGGTAKHSRIKVNIVSLLDDLVGDCIVYDSDMLIRTAENSLHTYPDASVVCGSPLFADEKELILTNPVLLVEVISDSSRSYDRGKKFKLYQQIESLKTYLLLEQEEIYAECYQKQTDNSWNYKSYDNLNVEINISQPEIVLPMSQIYRRVFS
jgi:Uma2 family endonuclease